MSEECGKMAIWSWGKFEREALDTCDGWRVWLFWPQFLFEIAFLIAAPIRDMIRKRKQPRP